MNKEFIKLDAENYTITSENGEMKIVNTIKNSSSDKLDNILKLENNIEELYNKLNNCNKSIESLNFRTKERKCFYKIIPVLMCVAPFVMTDISSYSNITDALLTYSGCLLFLSIPTGIALAFSIAHKGTKRSINNKKRKYEESKKQFLCEIKRKQKELTNLKNEVNYQELDLNKTIQPNYSYKFKPQIVPVHSHTIKKKSVPKYYKTRKYQSKTKLQKND